MLTNKQKSFLRGLANNINPIINIGKSGITPELTESLDTALESREIVKVHVLNNCMMDIKEIADILRDRTHCDIVQIIGNKIVFFRKSKKKPVIELPK